MRLGYRSDHLDGAVVGLIGQGRLDHRPPRPAVELTADEVADVAGPAFPVDGHLDQGSVLSTENRTGPVADLDMDMAAVEALRDGPLEFQERGSLACDGAVGLKDKTLLEAAVAPVVGVADLLGMAETCGIVLKHPEGTGVAVLEGVEQGPRGGHCIQGRLAGLVSYGTDPISIVQDLVPDEVIQGVYGLEQVCDDRVPWAVPWELRRQVSLHGGEVAAQSGGRGAAEELSDVRHGGGGLRGKRIGPGRRT
jgi:hypothetical protein